MRPKRESPYLVIPDFVFLSTEQRIALAQRHGLSAVPQGARLSAADFCVKAAFEIMAHVWRIEARIDAARENGADEATLNELLSVHQVVADQARCVLFQLGVVEPLPARRATGCNMTKPT